MGKLQDEVRQRRPFDTIEQEAMLSIVRTAAVLEHLSGETFKARGITATQYNVLRILRGAGEGGLCRNEVRDRLIAQVPDATRLLDRMEAMQLVTRERDHGDRRQVTARITPKGLALLEELEAPVLESHRRALGHMSRSELRTLIELLEKARASAVSTERATVDPL